MVPGKELGVGVTGLYYFQPWDLGPAVLLPGSEAHPPRRGPPTSFLSTSAGSAGPTWASGRPEPAPLPLPDTHSTSTQAPCWGRADGEAGLCRVGDGSGWAGRELGLMHPSLNWCSAWK